MPPEEEQKELEFKDIARLTNRDVQLVLREIAGKDIALALKGVDEDLRDCIFRNVSKRVATMIRDEMKLLAAAKIPDVLQMRSVITTIARGLASSGEITWPPSVVPTLTGDGPSRERSQAPSLQAARPKQKRSTRRTVIMVAGGIGSVAVLILLATMMGRLARPTSPESGKLVERKRTTSSKQKTKATPPGAVVQPAKEAAGEEGEVQAEGTAGDGAGAVAVASSSAAAAQQGSEPAAGKKDTGGEQGSTPDDASGDQGSPTLRPGDQIQTEGQSPAVYQLADAAGTLEVDPNSSLEVAPESEEPEAEKGPPRLNLRLGNIKVDVTDPELEVTSPLARITATEGSQYRIRVVLDATTTVTVTTGIVWLKPTARGETGPVMLRPGDEARISPTGRLSVSKRR
jgi:hypothetical protein